MRDLWWSQTEERRKNITETQEHNVYWEIDNDPAYESKPKNKKIAMYHVILENEGFEESASHIHRIVKECQELFPNLKRCLYLDIDAHKNSTGGFDDDMYELQRHFLLGYFSQFLSELNIPLCKIKNDKGQVNLIAEELQISTVVNTEILNEAIDSGISEIWVADKDKSLKL